MKKFFKLNFVSVLSLVSLLVFSGSFVFFMATRAAISSGAVAGNAAADLVAGATGADYNVSFDTNIGVTADSLWVIFPNTYTITNGDLGTSAVSDGTIAGRILVNGVSRSVNNVTGDSGNYKITIVLNSSIDLGTGTGTSFRFLTGIQNPTNAVETGTFTIDSDAAAEVEQSNVAGVTITAAAASYLKITGTATPVVGADDELTITAYDQYNNVCASGPNIYEGSKNLVFSGLSAAPDASLSTVETIALGSVTATTFTAGATNGTSTTLVVHKVEDADLEVSDGSINSTGGATYDLDIVSTPGTATSLVFTREPSSTTVSGIAIGTQPEVTAKDTYGNIDTNFTETITLTEDGGGDLTNNTQAAVSGVADFGTDPDLIYTNAADDETFTLTADDDAGVGTNLTPVVSGQLVAADVLATKLVITNVASTADDPHARFADNITVTVQAQNAGGILDNDDVSTISVAMHDASDDSITITSNTGTLSGGTATLATIQITAADLTATTADGAGLHLVATDTGGTPGTLTASVENTELDINFIATKLTVTTQPSGAADEVALTQQPVVKTTDANNNVDTNAALNDEVITASSVTAKTAVGGTVTKTIASGVATFVGLRLDVTASAYTDGTAVTLSFDDDGGMGALGDFTAQEATPTALAVVATKLVWTVSPATCVSGLPCETQGTIQAQDAHDNLDTGETTSLTVAKQTGAGTLVGAGPQGALVGGTLTTSGTGYSATADGEEFTFRVTGGTLTAGDTGTITSNVVATKLVITNVASTADDPHARLADNITVTVQAQNADNILDTTDVSTISVAMHDVSDDSITITSNTGTLVAGAATLATIQITAADLTATTLDGAGLHLVASDTGVGGTLTASAENTELDINFIATKLTVTTQPSGAADEVALTQQPVVKTTDANNNVDTNAALNDEVITASSVTAKTAVGGTVTKTIASGVATFVGLRLDVTASAYTDGTAVTLSFDDDGGMGALGDFTAQEATPTALEVVATKLVWTVSPATCLSGLACETQGTIQAQDAHDNLDTGYTNPAITIAKQTGAGTLVGTSPQGMSSGGTMTILGIGYSATADDQEFTLRASADGLTAGDTGTITSNVVATKLAITNVASTANDPAARFADNITITVQAQNADGILDNDDVSTISIAMHDVSSDSITITSNTGTLSAGEATLATVQITAADLTATTADGDALHLVATDTGGTPGTLTASAENTELTIDFRATKLKITTQPTGAVDQEALTGQPVVKAADVNDNIDTSNSSEVITASTATSGATVGGTATATMSAGIATFSGLEANVNGTFTDGANVTLSFNDDGDFASLGNFDAVTATPIALDVVSTILVWTVDPATCVSGAACTTQGTIVARDANSNLDTGKSATITVAKQTGAGTLVCGATPCTFSMSSGTVSTTGVGYTATADQQEFTLRASGGSLTAGDTGTLTADVVATKFLVTLNTNTPTAGAADTMTLTAANAGDITDTGYSAGGKTYTFTDSVAANLSTHTSPLPSSPTIPSSADVIAAFSSGVAPLATFTLVKAEALGTITVSDGVLSGTSASVTVKHAAASTFTVTPSSYTPDTTAAINVVVTAKDAYGNTADGGNGATAFTGIVFLTTNGTSPIWYNQVGNVTSGGTKTFASAIKFQTVEGSVTITAENSGATVTGTSSAITVSAGTAPTVSPQYPLNDATDVAITVAPTLTFSTAMDASTLNGGTIQLRLSSDDSAVSATITYNPTTYVVTITPTSSLANNTTYWLWASGAKNASGTTMTAYTTEANQDFTTVAAGAAPTVTAQTPLNDATSVAITVAPTLTFSAAMDASTLNGGTIQLRLSSDDSAVSATIVYNPSTYIVTVTPTSSLANNTTYWLWASGAKNASGTTMTAYTTEANQDFTTVAASTGSLAVDAPYMTNTTGTADNTYGNGWEWVMRVTLPTDQTAFSLKFNNWTSGSNTLAAASNMQYYSSQITEGTGSSGTPVDISAAATYPSNITISTDADSTRAGIQTDIHVKVKIPAATTAGSYSSTYTVRSQ